MLGLGHVGVEHEQRSGRGPAVDGIDDDQAVERLGQQLLEQRDAADARLHDARPLRQPVEAGHDGGAEPVVATLHVSVPRDEDASDATVSQP